MICFFLDYPKRGPLLASYLIEGKDYSGAKFFLYGAYMIEQSSLVKMKGIR